MTVDNEVEELAYAVHASWSRWMRYVFQQGGKLQRDGTFTISAEKVDRWLRQVHTNYDDLPESEKESDRKEARVYLEVLRPAR